MFVIFVLLTLLTWFNFIYSKQLYLLHKVKICNFFIFIKIGIQSVLTFNRNMILWKISYGNEFTNLQRHFHSLEILEWEEKEPWSHRDNKWKVVIDVNKAVKQAGLSRATLKIFSWISLGIPINFPYKSKSLHNINVGWLSSIRSYLQFECLATFSKLEANLSLSLWNRV